jgi:serine/threonine-protein kinase
VAFQHVHETVPRVADTVPDLPGEIDAIIASATATDPADRPADAVVLRERLTHTVAQLSEEELDVGGVRPAEDADQAPPAEEDQATRPVHQPTAVVPTSQGTDGTFARTSGNRLPRSATAVRAVSRAATRRRRGGLGAVLALVLLVIGAGGATAAWYFTSGPGIYSDMPDVVGSGEDQAVAAVEDADLGATVSRAFSEDVDRGRVIKASEEAGSPVRHGTDVQLQVSRGPERYRVPQLAGLTVQEATDELEATSLALGVVTEEFDEDVEEGAVLRSTPSSEDDRVPPETAVELVVSAGPEPIDIPDVTDLTESQAREKLDEAGFETETASERVNDPDVEEGSVVSQEPSGGQGVRGDTVTLTVSKGPALVTVPQVVGMQFREAKPLLEDLGLKVKREEIAQAFFGTVRFQSVEEGERVPEGTEVVLSVL